MATYTPRRGDIVWLSFTPQAGHEQAGHRPAFVVSPESYNRKTGLFIVCPITSKIKGYPFEVPIPSNLIPKSTSGSSVVLADQIKSLDWKARQARFIAKAGDIITEEVIAHIMPLIDPEA